MFGAFEVYLLMTSTPTYFLRVFETVCIIKTYKT